MAETLASDVVIDADVIGGSNRAGVICRFVDANNYWLANLNDLGSTVTLAEFTGGVSTTRASASIPLPTTAVYHLRVTCDADTITVAYGTITLFAYAPSSISYSPATAHQTATRHGISVGTSASCQVCSISVHQ